MSTNPLSDREQPFLKLSHQEKRALFLLSEGRSDREIARALFLGEGTIRNYINSVLVKLGLVDRVAATAYAIKHDLRGHLGYSD